MTTGLTVIIDAIKESRKIFQRMNSYAIYRITETLRVLLFMTLAILIFNFYPLTAVMIVMLALLNDGAILSIAYDNVHYKDQPEAWNMHMVLGVATVLGVIGPVAAFGLFYIGERVYHLDRPHIQTLMYLMLSVRPSDDFSDAYARPILVYTPRANIMGGRARYANRGDFVCGLWGVHDPLGWAGPRSFGATPCVVPMNDRVKLLAYRVFDPTAAPLLVKKQVDAKPVPADMTPQVAKRAYELYEQRGARRSCGRGLGAAEREVRKK